MYSLNSLFLCFYADFQSVSKPGLVTSSLTKGNACWYMISIAEINLAYLSSPVSLWISFQLWYCISWTKMAHFSHQIFWLLASHPFGGISQISEIKNTVSDQLFHNKTGHAWYLILYLYEMVSLNAHCSKMCGTRCYGYVGQVFKWH